jgi:uncharacterized protein YejL (UPF0352 family)
LIKDDHIRAFMQRLYEYFFQFSAPQQVPLMAIGDPLRNLINHGDADRIRKFSEFFQPFFLLGSAL